jgi:hypothetical protein
LTGRHVVLVTNRVDWSAAKIISLYVQRWPTETFYQLDCCDLRQSNKS